MEVRKAFYLKNPISSEMGVGQVNLPTEGKDFRKYEELLFEKAQEIWSICILTRTDQYGDELSSDNIEIYAVLKSRNRTEFCPIALVWPKLAINKTNENANALLVSKAPFLFHLLRHFLLWAESGNIKNCKDSPLYKVTKLMLHNIYLGDLSEDQAALDELNAIALGEDIHNRTISGGLMDPPKFTVHNKVDKKIDMLEEEADEDTYHNISLHLNAWVAFPEGEDEDLSQMTDMERKCAHHFTVSALNFNVPPDLPSPEDLEDMGIDVGFDDFADYIEKTGAANICSIDNSVRNPEESEANAILIARAPMMYYLLSEYVDAIDNGMEVTMESLLVKWTGAVLEEVDRGIVSPNNLVMYSKIEVEKNESNS